MTRTDGLDDGALDGEDVGDPVGLIGLDVGDVEGSLVGSACDKEHYEVVLRLCLIMRKKLITTLSLKCT